ncbi:MAG: YqaA family protein [Bacteroidota bacterium]
MDELSYIGLFSGCFLGATILPLATEAFVVAMLLGGYDPFWVVVVASFGNWLGGLTNYGLGYLADFRVLEKWFRVSHSKLMRFQQWAERYGSWSALVTWLPFIGDPLTIALGFFKINFYKVALLSFLGKLVRYIVLAYITLYL